MSYLVLARKWRPLTFDEMVGQAFISRTLKNAVRTGRVAHAFLFAGSRGVGKTSAARILAKCLNCDHGPTPEPCNKCPTCLEIIDGRSLDVYEIDGASNTSVDDIRELRENVRYLTRPGKRRVYIIDEVHMLSKSAFNALLKTLEEPPDHVVFIFATTEPHKVPETIQSRCQRFDFHRIPRSKILERLQDMAEREGYEIDDGALAALAKAADGSMRDAQSLLDQVISYCGSKVEYKDVAEILGMAGPEHFFRISEAVLGQDPKSCVEALDEIYRSGYDINQFYQDLVEHFRNILIARLLPDPAPVLEMTEAEIEELRKQASQAGAEDLRRLVSLLLKAEEDVLRSNMPRTGMEITLIKMAHLGRLEPLERILAKIGAVGQTDTARPAASGPGSASPPGREAQTGPASLPEASSASRPPKEVNRRATGRVGQTPERKTPGGDPDSPAGAEALAEGKDVPAPPRTQWNAPDAWQAFIDTVRSKRGVTAAMLEDVDRWEVGPDAVRVFCAEDSFLYAKLRQPETRTQLTTSANDCFGPSVGFEVCPVAGAKDRQGQPSAKRLHDETAQRLSPAALEEAQDSEVVKTALDLFHGTIKDVKVFGPEEEGEEEEGEPDS